MRILEIFKPYSHIRLSWKRELWKNNYTVQVRLIRTGEKTTLIFHHEKLIDAKQRLEMKVYWNKKMNDIERELSML